MKLEVYWLQLAEDKLFDIYYYHCEKASVRVAQKLVDSIIDTTIDLENNPEIGKIEESFINRAQIFRFLVYKNYKIIYWINYESERIEIANVFDTRQNPLKIEETKSF